MQTQLLITGDSFLIDELKMVVEGFIGQYKDKSIRIETKTETPIIANDIRQLKGILNNYYPKPLTDDEINNGIQQGILERAMIK